MYINVQKYFFFAPGSGQNYSFPSFFSLEESGNLMASCRSQLILWCSKEKGPGEGGVSLVSEPLGRECRDTVVSSSWGHQVLAHSPSSPPKVVWVRESGKASASVKIKYSAFSYASYLLLHLLPPVFCLFSEFTDCPPIPPGLAILFQTCQLDPLNPRETNTVKNRGFRRHFLVMLNVHKRT